MVRPHSGLGDLAPSMFARNSATGKQQDGALRYTEGSAPGLVAPPSQQGKRRARNAILLDIHSRAHARDCRKRGKR
jgi:hypothetical protein